MASIIEGYNYDVFISYRQKDNKGDRWVSEFVEALKTELESTFKEEISVYFDINPHDGLLETHVVSDSLKEKLKCLVFIPVISRTYCDPHSFAWEHEFKAFIELAGNDSLGLKVRLPHGNVATRVLPVKIHELDKSDQDLCENVLGGVLRGIDFIYKSAGVNRPLRMNEDNPKENQNHTYYRDQINKVANAIREIIHGLQTIDKVDLPAVEKKTDDIKTVAELNKNVKNSILAVIILLITGTVITFLVFSNRDKKNDFTIAFLPLKTNTEDFKLLNAGNLFVESVLGKLEKIKSLTVIPRITTLQYRETNLPMRRISKDLKSNFLVNGSIWSEGEGIMVRVGLSESGDESTLWSKEYEWDELNLNQVSSDITMMIASHLGLSLSAEEMKLIDDQLTNSAEANINYLSANAYSNESRFHFLYDYAPEDSGNFMSAIRSYDKAIELQPGFGLAYIKRSIAASWGFFTKQLDSTAISNCREDIRMALLLDKDLPDLDVAQGFYHYYCMQQFDSALYYFREAADKDPQDYQPLYYMSIVYRRIGDWDSARKLSSRVVRYNPREALFLTNIGITYTYLHQYDSALLYHQKAIDLMPQWRAPYANMINTLLLKTGRTKPAEKVMKKALENSGDSLSELRIWVFEIKGEFNNALELTLNCAPDVFKKAGEKYIELGKICKMMGNDDAAHMYYDTASVIIEKAISKNPDDYNLHSLSGLAHAGSGRKVEAMEKGEKAIALAEKNAMELKDIRLNMALTNLMLGFKGPALDGIERLLLEPSMISGKLILADPVWADLLDIPELRQALNKN